MTKHPRMIAAIALVTLTAVALTGCLVTKKEQESVYEERKSENLRIYKQGDWIQYNVIATSLSGTSTGNAQAGTLKISWGNYIPLTSPDNNASNGGNPYDVIEKRYLFCLDGAFCEPTETMVIQYVHQDDSTTDTTPDPTTDGTERLVAMGSHPTNGQYYWLNTTGGRTVAPANPDNNVTGGQEPVITLKSPLSINDTIYTVEYYLMDGCILGAASCQSDVGRFKNSINVVGDGTKISTNIGNYANPFQVNFSGDVFPDNDVDGQLPLTFDIFDLCSDGYSTHSGSMYIVPEIGVIQMRNTCTDSATGDITLYDITVDSISSSILSGS